MMVKLAGWSRALRRNLHASPPRQSLAWSRPECAGSRGRAVSRHGPAASIRAWVLAAALALAGAATQAMAQSTVESKPGPELGPEAQETPEAAAAVPVGARDFEVAITTALLLTDNALRVSAGDIAGASLRSDAHLVPDLFGRWTHQYERFRLAASAEALFDRYLSETELNEDTVIGNVEAALSDGTSAVFVPYLGYTVSSDLRPEFGASFDFLHSFYAGATSTVWFGSSDERGLRFLTLGASGGRTLADPTDFENSFALATGTLAFAVARDLQLSFEPTVYVRWYDTFAGEFRRDVRLNGLLRAIWTPSWLVDLIPSAEISASLGFLRNISTRADQDFSQWEGGPAIRLAWHF